MKAAKERVLKRYLDGPNAKGMYADPSALFAKSQE